MRKIILLIVILLLVAGSYLLYLLFSTGYFRAIDNYNPGIIAQAIEIPGAEDMTMGREADFLLISSTDRAALRDGNPASGGIYLLDLKQDSFEARLISGNFDKPFFPHGISLFHLDSNTYKVFAINHVSDQHFIEVFNLYKDSLVHQQTLQDEHMISPNDLVAVDSNRFYFSNDHRYTEGIGRFAEDFLGYAASNVVYFDGMEYREVAGGIAYANGINYDASRSLLYLASPRAFEVKVYQIEENGNLEWLENIPCGTGVDNIELDPEGNLWIGCHPDLMTFASYAQGKKEKAPSEIIRIEYRDKGDFSVETVFLDDGTRMSAASVATPYGDYIFTGNVMDQHFLVLKNK